MPSKQLPLICANSCRLPNSTNNRSVCNILYLQRFFSYGLIEFSSFFALIILNLTASGIMALRIIYWSIWAGFALTLPAKTAIELFNNENNRDKTYLTTAPNTWILQCGIKEAIKQLRESNKLSRLGTAIWTAGKSF